MQAEKDPAALRAVAGRVRSEWIDRLNSGAVDVRTLIEYSKKTDDDRYIAAIRLVNILAARSGWTKATALEALQQSGFTDKATIRTLRKAPTQVPLFEAVLSAASGRFRPRPSPPAGWPWSGKLAVLVREAGEEVPEELLILMEEDGPEDADDEGLDPDLLNMLEEDDDEDFDGGDED